MCLLLNNDLKKCDFLNFYLEKWKLWNYTISRTDCSLKQIGPEGSALMALPSFLSEIQSLICLRARGITRIAQLRHLFAFEGVSGRFAIPPHEHPAFSKGRRPVAFDM
jgi:hypothetical protein